MRILAIETSGVHCSAAVWADGSLYVRHQEAPRRHGELLLPMMEAVLEECGIALTDLDAVAFGHGPGSFTGVRIAAAVAQGAAFGAQRPLVGVSTLAALAHAGWRRHRCRRILVAIDARISELYWGLYDVDGRAQVRSLGQEAVGSPETVRVSAADATADRPLFGVGNAWRIYRDSLLAQTALDPRQTDPDLSCSAADVAELAATAVAAGRISAPEGAMPVYLRDRVAVKPGKPSSI